MPSFAHFDRRTVPPRSIAAGTPTASLVACLADDGSGETVRAWRAGLAWQIGLADRLARSADSEEDRSRNEWHADAMRAASDVLGRLRRLAMSGAATSRPAIGAEPAAPVDAPTTRMLVETGWLAWELRFEPEALRILGGLGGLLDGAVGRAIFQASALLQRERLEEAGAVLHRAVRAHGDPRGEASATLAMLWRARGDPAWESLARIVAESASDESARRTCAEALKTATTWPRRRVPGLHADRRSIR